MPFEGELPLYQQLAELLKEEIHAGRYKQGQKLPTELELCKLYHVSRNTVRGAFNSWNKRICCCGNRERELLSAKKSTITILSLLAVLPICVGKSAANLMPR